MHAFSTFRPSGGLRGLIGGGVPSSVWAALLVLGLVGSGSSGDGPPYPPERALATFELEDGFRIELFAAEPVVSDPVDMAVDAAGNVYVVEMHGYPLDVSGSGVVRLLSDGDGDGRPDESTVFADSLTLPTGVTPWKDGVLVTDAPDVLYLEDRDGDGRADVQRTVVTGFALSNPQHNFNSPVYGLDNWIYLANEGVVGTDRFPERLGDEGSEIHFPHRPAADRLPRNGGGRNVRMRPEAGRMEMLSAGSQFGHTFDRWGHQFLTSNSTHIYEPIMARSYLRRNPHLPVSSSTETISDHGQPARVFPITESPQFQMLTRVGVMTSASGLTAYLGGAFPPPYGEATFVAENVHNVVHVDRLSEGSSVPHVASRIHEKQEFLASRDRWFRPVNFYVGPRGALYVLDYYRKYIEHPEWMSDETVETADLYAGRDHGRIYRIVPEGGSRNTDRMSELSLNEASTETLVEALDRPNIWWRRTAQRLLVDRGDRSAVEPLKRLVREGARPEGRLHALWTLEGLDRLDAPLIERALDDPHPGVRENAVRLAEKHLEEDPSLRKDLTGMSGESHRRVEFQLLCSLGSIDTEEARRTRIRMLFEHVEDRWMQAAALSAASVDPSDLFDEAVRRLGDRESGPRTTLFYRLAAMVGASGGPEAARDVLAAAVDGDGGGSWWSAPTVRGLADGLEQREDGSFPSSRLTPTLGRLLASLYDRSRGVREASLELFEETGLPGGQVTDTALQRASDLLGDRSADPELRADAVHLLSFRPDPALENELRGAVHAGEPLSVQIAAVRVIGQFAAPDVDSFLLSRWEHLTGQVRSQVLDVLIARSEGVRHLLSAIEAGDVSASSLSRSQRYRAMEVEDADLAARARELLETTAGTRSEVVDEYRTALTIDGDPEAGSHVFDRVCARCHQIEGDEGIPFGPDLATVRSMPPQGLVTAILDPDRSIADGFELRRITRRGGETERGVVSAETFGHLELTRPTGETVTVPRTDIRSMEALPVSGMPLGLEEQISPREMADLLAFIRSY